MKKQWRIYMFKTKKEINNKCKRIQFHFLLLNNLNTNGMQSFTKQVLLRDGGLKIFILNLSFLRDFLYFYTLPFVPLNSTFGIASWTSLKNNPLATRTVVHEWVETKNGI